VPRLTADCKRTKATPKVDPHFAEPIKAMIEKEPSFGYRTVAWLLGFNTSATSVATAALPTRWKMPAAPSSSDRFHRWIIVG
jgi:hypothetical protein